MKVFYPTPSEPYIISSAEPIFLRLACATGRNRSPIILRFLMPHLHNNSTVLPQYGAFFSDYDNEQIYNIGVDTS